MKNFCSFFGTRCHHRNNTPAPIQSSAPPLAKTIRAATLLGKLGEAEVLFRAGAVFNVTGGTDCIDLTEVSSHQVDAPITLHGYIFSEDKEVHEIYR